MRKEDKKDRKEGKTQKWNGVWSKTGWHLDAGGLHSVSTYIVLFRPVLCILAKAHEHTHTRTHTDTHTHRHTHSTHTHTHKGKNIIGL